MTHMVPKQYSTYDSDKGLSSAWLNSMLMNVSGADKGSPGLAPGINSNGKNSPALNPNNGNGRNSNGRNSPGFDASEEDSANSPSNGTTAPKNTDWRTMEGVGAENDMWEVNSPSKTALKHSMCIARACSYSTASAESPAKHKNWSNSEVMLTEGEKQVMREEEKASSIQVSWHLSKPWSAVKFYQDCRDCRDPAANFSAAIASPRPFVHVCVWPCSQASVTLFTCVCGLLLFA